MPGSRLTEQPRVMGRQGARNLSEEEAAQVRGGQNQIFAFTHIISNDVTHD